MINVRVDTTVDMIGALSSDLYRVALCFNRGSFPAANRFYLESKRWTTQLETKDLPKYIQKIIRSIAANEESEVTDHFAQECLMYSVLLENYVIHEMEKY